MVILARDEERTIAEAVEAASAYAQDVIVMDGRSRDGTADAARKAGARVFTDPGLGKGSGIRESLGHSQAEVLVFMDANGSHDPADIPRLAGMILSDDADLCVGCRFSGGSEELSVSTGQLIRTVGNIAMNIAINHRWNVQLSDTLNGFRAVRRAVALRVELAENRHTIEQEMVMKFLRHGYRVVNIPTHEYPREFGTSHIRIWREWPMFVWCVLKNVAARDLRQNSALADPNAADVRMSDPVSETQEPERAQKRSVTDSPVQRDHETTGDMNGLEARPANPVEIVEPGENIARF